VVFLAECRDKEVPQASGPFSGSDTEGVNDTRTTGGRLVSATVFDSAIGTGTVPVEFDSKGDFFEETTQPPLCPPYPRPVPAASKSATTTLPLQPQFPYPIR
jgi:hypothetical protein